MNLVTFGRRQASRVPLFPVPLLMLFSYSMDGHESGINLNSISLFFAHTHPMVH